MFMILLLVVLLHKYHASWEMSFKSFNAVGLYFIIFEGSLRLIKRNSCFC